MNRTLHGFKIEEPNAKEKYYYLKRVMNEAEKGVMWAIAELSNNFGIEGNNDPEGYDWGNGPRGGEN